jgi:hypothetical protein
MSDFAFPFWILIVLGLRCWVSMFILCYLCTNFSSINVGSGNVVCSKRNITPVETIKAYAGGTDLLLHTFLTLALDDDDDDDDNNNNNNNNNNNELQLGCHPLAVVILRV